MQETKATQAVMTVIVILILVPTTVFIFFRELRAEDKEDSRTQTALSPTRSTIDGSHVLASASAVSMLRPQSQVFQPSAGVTMQPQASTQS